MQSQKDSKLWKLIGPRIKTAKETAEKDALRLLVDSQDARAKIAAGQAIAYEHILNEVENAERNIEVARERLATIRDQIRTAKERGGIIE